MKTETLLIDQSGYGSKDFEWPSATFYNTMYKKMWRYAWTLSCRNSIDYYKDIFQETMETFHVLYTNKPDAAIVSNRHAYNMVKRIFWFAVVNDYRKYKDWYTKAAPLPNEEYPERPDVSSDPDFETLDKKLESFFSDIAKYLEQHPDYMTVKERRFYHYYNQLVQTPIADKEMRELICKLMKITVGNYQVLKTRVNNHLKKLIYKFSYVQK